MPWDDSYFWYWLIMFGMFCVMTTNSFLLARTLKRSINTVEKYRGIVDMQWEVIGVLEKRVETEEEQTKFDIPAWKPGEYAKEEGDDKEYTPTDVEYEADLPCDDENHDMQRRAW